LSNLEDGVERKKSIYANEKSLAVKKKVIDYSGRGAIFASSTEKFLAKIYGPELLSS